MYSSSEPGGGASKEWSSGLFDCFDDSYLCFVTFCCPCIMFGRTAEIVDRGATSCGTSAALFALVDLLTLSWCTWAYSCMYRSRLRAQHGLPEEPCADVVVHLFCWPCAICQEYRELRTRGYDPALGWEGASAGAMSAPATQGMGR